MLRADVCCCASAGISKGGTFFSGAGFVACWVVISSCGTIPTRGCAKDKDDLKARLNKLHGDTTGKAVAPEAEFRHTDMESAHQHILYLETKVRAMEELDPWAASLAKSAVG